MQISDFNFPHPVLTDFTDDIDSKIEFGESVTETEDVYEISVNFEIDNIDLQNLLKTQQALNICEVQCSGTLYRETFKSYGDQVQFIIPRKEVRGTIDIECYLVSDKPINGYNVAQSHSDYSKYNIDIERGDLLAYYGGFQFHADIQYEKLRAVSSFLQIVEDDSIDVAKYDLEEPRIVVKLPREDYEKYSQSYIMRNEDFISVIHSSIVLPALIHALYNIEEYEDRKWAQVIRTRVQEEEQFENETLEDPNDFTDIAQKLLGKPVTRLMNGLDSIYKKMS